MDSEGGENIDLMERLYCILYKDAVDRSCHVEEHHHLSAYTIGVFRRFQGRNPWEADHRPSLMQAYLIWHEPSYNVARAVLTANGFGQRAWAMFPGEDADSTD